MRPTWPTESYRPRRRNRTTNRREPAAHPGARPRHGVLGTFAATAATAVAIGGLATASPVLAYISLNHNEAVVRSTERGRRVTKAQGAAAIAAAASATLCVGLSALTSTLGFITYNHNETMVRSAARV